MMRRRDQALGVVAGGIIVVVAVVLGALAAGYRPVIIQTGSMAPTAPPDALVVAVPRDADQIVVGDIVVMRRPGATPVTHRVIEIEGHGDNRFALTKGDANEAADAAPYPLGDEELVARWIRPGWGGVIESVFQPGVALAVMAITLLALVAQALRFIWRPPAVPRVSRLEPELAERLAVANPPRRSRKPMVLLVFPLTGLLTTGVAWAVFSSAENVASNDFATADCFDAQLGSVQSGETVHAVSGNVSVPITAVDPTGSFVLASVRSASGDPPDSFVQVQLGGGGTTVELDRLTDTGAPPPVTVAWSVVEYLCGVTVQRGTAVGDDSAQVDVAISAVDTSTSFAVLSSAAPFDSSYVDGDEFQIAELTSSTNLRIRAAGAMSATRSFAWQVVSFDDPGDAAVQVVNTTMGAGTTIQNVPIPSPVDPASTFVLVGTTNSATGNSLPTQMVRAHLLDSTTVEVSRIASAQSSEVSIQLVTLREGSTVRHGVVDFAAGQPAQTVTIDPVDPARSTAMSTVAIPGVASGGRTDFATNDIAGEASATFVVTDPRTVSIERASTGSNASFGWQVIEWAGPGWWDPAYDFRQRIDVATGTAAAPGEYTVPVTIDHASLVAAGLSRTDGQDVRVLSWDGSTWTELDRVLDDGSTWDQASTTLRFRTVDPIAANDRSSYWLYFGNTTPALAFADPENVWLLTEDFESGTLGDFEDRTTGTAWYAADPWTRRIPITIPAGRTTAPLSDFPLLVSLVEPDLALNALPDGSDIRFTAADGSTPLDHELESFDAGTGTLDAWVRMPTIASATPTTLYLYYGAPNAPQQADVRATWPSDLEAVWHLSTDPAGRAPQADDSTVRNHDGLSGGAMTAGDLVTGIVADGVDFDGIDDVFEVDPFDLTSGALTLSAWVQLDAYGTDPRLLTKANDDSSVAFELSVNGSGNVRGRLTLGGTDALVVGTGGGISLGTWHHVAMTWDGAMIRVYVDGAETGAQPAAGSLASDAAMPVTIGGIASLDRQLDGRLDEVRVERTARSAAWIGAAESNQRNPGSFAAPGPVETGVWLTQGAWTARKPVVVDSTVVSADAIDFPLLIQLTDAELQAGASVTGADLVVTAADGTTRLDHTVETWDSTTGSLSAWVRIPLLSSTVDTELFLYYGNPTAVDQQDPGAVFGPDADLAFLGAS